MKKKELRKLLKRTQKALESIELAKPSKDTRTLSEWLVLYEKIQNEKGYDPHTISNHRSTLNHIRRIWGGVCIAELKPYGVSSGLGEFLPQKTSTAGRVLSELREVLSEAIANGWAESNPALHVKAPHHKVLRGRLSFEVWQRMLEHSKNGPQRWVPAMLLLGLLTGQRRADLAKMKFEDVVDGHLRIEQQKLAGKRRGARVALPLDLRLNEVGMSVGEVVEYCRGIAKPGETLLRKAGGGPIEVSSLSARFAETIRAVLGPEAYEPWKWPSLHEVRSLSARMYRKQGTQDVQGIMGHKHPEMTAQYEDTRDLDEGDGWKVVAI